MENSAKMRFEKFLNERDFVFVDGATGTELQKLGLELSQPSEYWSIEEPQMIKKMHLGYLNAGSDIICANTFGSSKIKLEGAPYAQEELITASVRIALEAVQECGREALVTYDMGPLGVLMYPNGSMTFEDAYNDFANQARIAEKAGADLILIETMSDIYELKAALFGAKENSNLPIICSMTFEVDGRSFSGTDVETYVNFAVANGANALGINCSNGPKALGKVIDGLLEHSQIPIMLKPNAGMPDPATGAYSLGIEEFAQQILQYAKRGAKILGGCCGTGKEYIKGLKDTVGSTAYERIIPQYRGNASSNTKTVYFDQKPLFIGERINPSGNAIVEKAIRDSDYAILAKIAVEQERAGADLIDINVSLPDIDEAEVMRELVLALMAVCRQPLVLDSKNPKSLEVGLRTYNGRAIVNSVSAKDNDLEEILPLVKHYGSAVVVSPISEDGVPETIEERKRLIKKIVTECEKLEIRREDIIVDCLALPVQSAPDSARVCLDTIKMIKEEYGLYTLIGLSNISHGLIHRRKLNEVFLAEALASGLDFVIAQPSHEELHEVLSVHQVLMHSEDSLSNYHELQQKVADMKPKTGQSQISEGELENALVESIKSGLEKEAKSISEKLLDKREGMEIIKEVLLPVLDGLGQNYNDGEIFLPQLLQAAQAAQAALDLIRASIPKQDEEESHDSIILATVEGDIHDIGKNIAKTILENYGYHVIDLGRDVAPATVLQRVIEEDCKLIGLSALMTTTLPAMAETIKLVKAEKPDCKVMLGGAVLTEEYAESIGADYYCPDANSDIACAREVFGE